MAEEKQKKVKIYQVAKELNISHDTIIDFLNEKGFAVKSLMSIVSDEMMNDIMVRFRKDKDIAVIHKKKIREFKEKYRKTELEEEEKLKQDKKRKESKIKEDSTPVELPVEPVEIVEAEIAESKQEVIEQPVIDENKDKPAEVDQVIEETVVEQIVTPKDQVEILAPLEKIKVPAEEVKVEKHQVLVPVQKGTTTTSSVDADKEKPKKRKRKKRPKDEFKLDKHFDFEELALKKKKKTKIKESNQQDVEDAIKRTFAEMEEAPVKMRSILRKKKKKERLEEQQRVLDRIEEGKSILKVTEFTSVNELANIMNVKVTDVIHKCIGLGQMVSINQRLEADVITLVADEFGYEVEFVKEFANDKLMDFEDTDVELKHRAPVVTIMGHVDHGKTSLLDYIRSANVVAGESGGITQHIGAYKVSLDGDKEITFIDTPGHEAFTSMRARGARITDIVVLVVAADDSVMPQTIEAINHAQAANVSIIVAINKIDKPSSNTERIRQQLSEKGILVEEWGGKYQCVEISAKFGTKIKELLEKILLEAEILDLKANSERKARGVLIEAELDKGKGIIATVLVQKGTLRVGDPFIAGIYSGKVRAMLDERGNRIESAPPSTPVQILGFDGIPQAGDEFIAFESERESKEISSLRQQLKREQDFRLIHHITLDEISKQIKEGETKELVVIVKGDVDGSVEALSDSLMKLSNSEVKVNVIHKGVGTISETDIYLASASKAIIIGFHIRPNLNARKLAEKEQVEIRLYNIIYDAINEIRNALEGLLNPEISEEILATIEVRDIFKVPKIGTVAGCYVQDGKIIRNNKIRLIRDGLVIHQGFISSLKRFKDDVREVDSGFECGIGVENYNDVKVGDIIEAFKLVEKKRKLTMEKA